MSNLLTYSPEEITILIAGVVPVTGLVDGSFLTITRDFPMYSSKITADGVIARNYNASQSFTIKLSLHNLSPSNDVLDALRKLDELTQEAKFPLFIKDQLGSTLFFSTTTWVEALPTVEYGKDIGVREWIFRSSQGGLTIGGNDGESSILGDLLGVVSAAAPLLGGFL